MYDCIHNEENMHLFYMYFVMISSMQRFCRPVLKFNAQDYKDNHCVIFQGLVLMTSIAVHCLIKVASVNKNIKYQKFLTIVTLICQHRYTSYFSGKCSSPKCRK